MSGQHFTGGEMPHTPTKFLPNELMTQVEANVVYACTDVVLQDPATRMVFLGSRQIEPQKGPWLVGGRNAYGHSIEENATKQVGNDLGIDVDPSRFRHVATYSTDFPVASPGREDHGRHTQNAVMLANLKPDEVQAINEKVATGDIRDEYKGGKWHTRAEIADKNSDFPYAIKQLVRDLNDYDLLNDARHDAALQEDKAREAVQFEDAYAIRKQQESDQRVTELVRNFNLTPEQAAQIESASGPNATYSFLWARTESDNTDNLENVLKDILENPTLGDIAIRAKLKASGVHSPEVISDNGPALRAILGGGALAATFNDASNGELFMGVGKLQHLGRPGPHDNEQL